MAEGGIYDHLGGGFCRYSVDRFWTIPHFEKMLYDNGPLLALYSDAWLVTKQPLYEKVARETAEWVLREMQSPEGGYYSSLDADSEGVEGKFYVWTRAEVTGLLSGEEYPAAALHFGLDRAANFEEHHWHLRVAAPARCGRREAGTFDWKPARHSSIRHAPQLFAVREKRVSARPRRESADELERAHGEGHGARGPRVQSPRVGRFRAPLRSISSARRCGATGGFSRRTRTDARISTPTSTITRFLLDALLELMQTRFPRGRSRVRARDRRPPPRALRGPRARRILLRER